MRPIFHPHGPVVYNKGILAGEDVSRRSRVVFAVGKKTKDVVIHEIRIAHHVHEHDGVGMAGSRQVRRQNENIYRILAKLMILMEDVVMQHGGYQLIGPTTNH